MSEPESYVSSSHTVAELKAMCKENGLAINGKKADLISRLNDFFTGVEPKEESISLEDEESISMEEEIVSLESESVPLPSTKDDVLEAEVLDAEFIDEEEPV